MFQQTCTTHLWLIHIFRWCHMGKLSFFAIQKYIYALLTACVPMQSVAQWDCDFASNFQKPHMCCIANDGLETVALMKHGKFSNQQKRILNGIFTLHVPKMWHSVSNSLNVCIYIYIGIHLFASDIIPLWFDMVPWADGSRLARHHVLHVHPPTLFHGRHGCPFEFRLSSFPANFRKIFTKFQKTTTSNNVICLQFVGLHLTKLSCIYGCLMLVIWVIALETKSSTHMQRINFRKAMDHWRWV